MHAGMSLSLESASPFATPVAPLICLHHLSSYLQLGWFRDDESGNREPLIKIP